MIPINPNEIIKYNDESGMVLHIRPFIGETEYQVNQIFETYGTDTQSGIHRIVDALFDLFVCGWDNAPVEFPKDGCPHKYFRFADKNALVNYISNNINNLTIEEKKS